MTAPTGDQEPTITVEEIRAAHADATPGPYRWAGNTDRHDIRLVGRGYGDVLATLGRERKADDHATRQYASYLREIQISDGHGGYRDLTDDEIADQVRTEFLEEPYGEPREDEVLAVFDPEAGVYRHARDLAVYEVGRNQGLPDGTPDSDERIYRRDVVDVRNPNARFLRDSWKYVEFLLAEVKRLRSRDAVVRAYIDEAGPDDTAGGALARLNLGARLAELDGAIL